MSTFTELLDGVASYYGSGSDEWAFIAQRVAQSGVTPDVIPLIQQVPGVTITRSASGKILGYDYANPFPTAGSAASIIDSNVDAGSYGLTSFTAQVPATAQTQGGITSLQSGAISSTTGNVVRTVADRVSLGLAGVALGTKLGLAIDSALYNVNPEWWDEHYPTVNPETWADLIPDNAAGGVVRSLLGIDGNEGTMYLDAKLLAYGYLAMLKGGAWNPSGTIDFDGDVSSLNTWFYDEPLSEIELPFNIGTVSGVTITQYGTTKLREMTSSVPHTATVMARNPNTYPTANQWGYKVVAASEDPDIVLNYTTENGSMGPRTVRTWTANGHTYYYALIDADFLSTSVAPTILTPDTVNVWESVGFWAYGEGDPQYQKRGTGAAVAYIMLYGTESRGRDEGIETNPNASIIIDPDAVINPTTGEAVTPNDDIDDVLTALQTAYPGLFNDTIYEDIPQDDGTVERVIYVPVPYPTSDTEGNPVTDLTPGVDPQTQPQITEEARPDDAQNLTDDTVTPPAPPDTGSGEGPAAVIPTGSASGLWSIYNPTLTELQSFGAWLWSSNFVDQLLKLFNDPMQSIIGLHKVFCTPPTSGRGNIRVGYLDSQVETNLVSGQYVTIDCGSVSLREYFGNVLDYDPFTKVSIYLPFIGIEPLDTGDVMRGTVGVKYRMDVLTGACLAEVTVTRDSAGGILYTYSGNAAVQYPVSSGSYMGILSSMLSVAGGVVGTIASGGAMAPLAMGAANGLLSARTRVQHSGGFTGNAGAMGARVPYLIITRPQSAVADSFENYEGVPANHTTTLGRCTGFVRAKAAHLDGVPALASELAEIDALLSEGIYI